MAHKTLHFVLVDDDQEYLQLNKRLFEKAGYQVTATTSSAEALEQIIKLQPDCVLSDLTMPDLDGFDLFKNIRKQPNIKQPTFIILTGKIFDFDRSRALQLGVDGYLTKPLNPKTFVDDVLEIMQDKITVQFWGVRGTLPVPGKKTIIYGGNTNCVTLSLPKDHFFIFDGGTGIKELSNYLVEQNKFPMVGKIFISHPHWDHINGIPFFAPLYMKGNEFEILGASHYDINIEKIISDQMSSVYFPITTKEFAAKLSFRNLTEEKFDIDDINIQTILLNHPGRCLGYRVQYKNKIFCYVTDNELYLENMPHYNKFDFDRLFQFIYSADVVVIDTTYTDEEYLKKVNWGHSCVSRVIDIVDKAQVKLVCFYHHDPDQFDKEIKLKYKQAQLLLKARNSKTQCMVPREGDKIFF